MKIARVIRISGIVYRSLLVVCAAGCLVLLVLPLSANLQTKPKPLIDLNGTWKDGSFVVKITQIGNSVVAKHVEPRMCDPRVEGVEKKSIETDFVGTIFGNQIEGFASVCNRGESWGPKAGVQTAKMVLKISEDQNTLVGYYEGYPDPKDMKVTRECKPDDVEMCESVGRAIAAMKGAFATPSAALYENLKRDVGVELGKIKSNLCDKPEKASELEALQRDLESLSFQPGKNAQNNIVLARIEGQVKQYGVDLCGRSSTDMPPPPSCPQGTTVKTEDDGKMFNSFKTKLKENLTTVIAGPGTILKQAQTRRCLDEMLGQGCSPDDFIKNLQVAAMVWQEGPPSKDICNRACQALGAWYGASACSKDGLTNSVVVEKCISTCRFNDFTQPN